MTVIVMDWYKHTGFVVNEIFVSQAFTDHGSDPNFDVEYDVPFPLWIRNFNCRH